MAKKRRRYKTPNNNIVAVQSQPRSAADGYVNSLAYLGEASELSKANDYERHPISNNYELLTVMYRENWLAARIIDTPCEDMTRAWYTVASEIDQEKLDDLAKLEAKHSVQQEITNAIRWARLYGGAAAVMVIKGQEDMLEEPLDFDLVQPGCFRGLIVVDKTRGIFPSIELEEDMDDPEFGYPKYYDVMLDEEKGALLRIHHSRLLLFKGRMLPIDEEIREDYWGASEIEHVYEELQKRNSTSANIAQLIFQANVGALKMSDFGEVMGMGTPAQREQVYRTIMEMNRLRTSFGITLMSQEDSYEQHPYSFAGIAEVYETFMMDMAGAAEIPATKLFGRAPQGMNSTGESDMKNYYEVIAQLQERQLKPALEKLLPVMCMSLWGVVPDDLEIVFEPLGTTTPSERATIMSQLAGPIVQAYSAGLVTQRMALMELRETGKPINAWTNISDEDIEKASDEFDTGEMGGEMGMPPEMGGMPPEMGGAPTGEEMPQEEIPQQEMADPEAPAEEEPDVEPVPDETQDDLSGRIDTAIARVEGLKGQDPERVQAILEKMQNLQRRLSQPEGAEDGGPGSGPPPGYHKKHSLFGRKPPESAGMSAPKQAAPAQMPKAAPVQQMPKAAPVNTPAAPKAPAEKKGLFSKARLEKKAQEPKAKAEKHAPKSKPEDPMERVREQARMKKERERAMGQGLRNHLGFGKTVKSALGGIVGGVAGAIGSFNKEGIHGGPGGGGGAGSSGESNTANAGAVNTANVANEIKKHTNSQEMPNIVKPGQGSQNGQVGNKEQTDGGPGSGPRPGYHKNGASLAERAKFMLNPAEGLKQNPSQPRTSAQVKQANQERKDWSDLTMHQRIAGNSSENRHIRKMKKEVMKAAAKGDIQKAKQIVNANKHYWQNDPQSAMKVQTETLKRQKAAKKGLF